MNLELKNICAYILGIKGDKSYYDEFKESLKIIIEHWDES